MDSKHWLSVWRGLAFGLLRDGFHSADAVVRWARENGFPLWVVKRALEALAVEQFDHDGERYWRLSGKVVPILPHKLREAGIYCHSVGVSHDLGSKH